MPAPTWDGWIDAVSYTYSAAGDLVGAQDANGKTTSYVYDRHLMVQETDRDGVDFFFVYDGDDATASCIRTWGTGGIVDHESVYDRMNMRTFVTDSLGHTTTYVMNAANAVVQVIDAHGALTKTEYNDWLWKTAEINALGAATRFEHDGRGNVTKTTLPNGATSTVAYGHYDLPTGAFDFAGVEWQWLYDERGRLLVRRTTAGELLRDPNEGKRASVVEVNHDRYVLRHDDQGNVTHITRPDGATFIRKFDNLGRLKAWRDVAGNLTELERDRMGRVTETRSPDGAKRRATYSAEGDVLSVFNGYAAVTYTYEGYHWLGSRTIAGDTVRWGHDTEGRLLEVTNENGELYKFVRDARGDVAEEVGFDGRTRVFVRDAAGRVTMHFKPSKSHDKISYDEMGNVLEILHPDGSKETFTYSPTGRLLSAANGEGTVSFERDARGRVLREAFGDDWVRSALDDRHRRVSVVTSRGLEEQIERDALGAARAVSVPTADWQATIERNVFGQETARLLPGGVHARWDRDPTGRPLAHHVAQAGHVTRSAAYTWEGPERIASLEDSVLGPSVFFHDKRSRLIGAEYPLRGERQHRFLDPAGNIYKHADGSDRRYGKGGVLLEAAGTTYAYDRDGNLITKELPTGERWEYVWNGAGLLAEVKRPDGTVVTFTYDALARRIAKTVLEPGKLETTVRWVWDGNVPVHEVANDERVTTWLFEPGKFSPLAKLGSEGAFAILVDHLGTPSQMFDQVGQLAWQMQLDVFGKGHVQTQRTICPWRSLGQYYDSDIDLHYNRLRHYSASTAANISQDPIRLYGGTNIYGFVANPLLQTDIFGLSCSIDSDELRENMKDAGDSF